MSFQPVLPFGGYAGWKFLTRTLDSQRSAFDKSVQIERDTKYFQDKIGAVNSAEDLVADRRLLGTALGAFGLDADINSKFFIKKVLEDGTFDTSDLANKLADKRYREFSAAFGFGDFSTPRTKLSDFGAKIAAAYRERQFEAAVGESDENMRLALGARRELGKIAGKSSSEDTKWLSVMGSPPLRKVFETAFGLPSSFAALDLDRQMDTLRDHATRAFGDDSVAQFNEPERMEDLVRLFLLRGQVQQGQTLASGASTALQLLQSSQGGGGLSLFQG